MAREDSGVAPLASEVSQAQRMAASLLRGLARCQEPGGNLRDPVTGEPLAPSHYAVSLFAGAAALSQDPELKDPAARGARSFLHVAPSLRGAHELNNLGLLAFYRAWDGAELRGRVRDYLLRMPFASLGGRTTNNWHAMRAVCLLQRGLALLRPQDVEAARECLRNDVLPLQDAAGIFADYPPNGVGSRCTPLTYHAKFCAMLAMFLRELRDPRATEALRKGVAALARLCAPDGEALYFGRSCNALYGYAAALYALTTALHMDLYRGSAAERVSWAALRIQELLGRLIRPDGDFRTYPTPFERERLGWDDYVHRLDYGAFAAFLLVQTPSVPDHRPNLPPVRWEARDAGLWVERYAEQFAAFATHGQLHPRSYLFVDARSSGLQVLTWKVRGHTVIPPPPHEMADPADPQWVGFMPVLEASGQVGAVRVYPQVRSFASPAGVAFAAQGVPVVLRPTATHRAARRVEGNHWLGWALGSLRRLVLRMRVQPPAAYREVALTGCEVRRALVWFHEEACLVAVDQFVGEARLAWGTLRLAVPVLPVEAALRFDRQGLRGQVRFLYGIPTGVERKEVFTSNGLAYVIRYRLQAGVPAVAAVVVGEAQPWCQTLGPALRVGAGSHSVVINLHRLEVCW